MGLVYQGWPALFKAQPGGLCVGTLKCSLCFLQRLNQDLHLISEQFTVEREAAEMIISTLEAVVLDREMVVCYQPFTCLSVSLDV